MKQRSIFAERFLKLRRDQTQAEFAEFLGVSRPTVGFYESGERIPDAITLERIARRCNVSADWLLGLSDNPSVKENNQIAQKTLGISPEAVENLAKVARIKRYPYAFSFPTELDKQVLGAALNLLLSSEALVGIAHGLYHLLDASAKMRELKQWSVEKLIEEEGPDCDEAFADYRLARLDVTESIQALMDCDKDHFLNAREAEVIAHDYYTRLDEANKKSEQQGNRAFVEWNDRQDEEWIEYKNFIEREGLDEGYGSDETKDN